MMGFGKGFGGMMDIGKRMDQMMKGFGDMDLGPSGGDGNMVCKSYSYSSAMGPDGKRHVEKKFTNQAQAKGKNGQIISEKQEMYKNSSTGEKRIAKERNLGDQGQ